jgi:hypothetical protein
MEGRGKLKDKYHVKDLGVNGRSRKTEGKRPLGKPRSKWKVEGS